MAKPSTRSGKLARLRQLQEQQAATALQAAAHAVRLAEQEQTLAQNHLEAWAAWKSPLLDGGLPMARYLIALDAEMGALADVQRASEHCEQQLAACSESREAYGRKVKDREVVSQRHQAQAAAANLLQEHRESDAAGELWLQGSVRCK
jgi:hypothetical protein